MRSLSLLTIKDIAREAGVSIATVSRVLNHKSVRPDSQLRVEAAIKKLDYTPNTIAQGLMGKQTKAVGVMVTSLTNQYYMEITEVIEKRTAAEGSMLVLCSTDGDHNQEKAYLKSLVARQVDGIIIVDPSLENYKNGLFADIARRTPLVLIHSYPGFSGFNIVSIDQYLGMGKVMEYLWNDGHRRIAFLRGHHGYSYDIKEQCWRDFLRKKDQVPREEDLIVVEQGNTEDAIPQVQNSFRGIFERDPGERPTAVFACNDLMASAVMNKAISMGLSIPGDVSVVGHDNTAVSQYSFLPMTTVDLKLGSLANAAADLLRHAMDPLDPEPRRVLLEPEIVIRASSGAPGSLSDSSS